MTIIESTFNQLLEKVEQNYVYNNNILSTFRKS